MGKAEHQIETWRGDFGRRYTDRNLYTIAELDDLYNKLYGMSRSDMNRGFTGHLDRRLSILEVGCNVGNQLLLLQQAGFRNLKGIDLQHYALDIAHSRLRITSLSQGSALDLPFADRSFDLVYTSGVLIHLPPSALTSALKEIHRCARLFIWGFEYYAEELTQIRYRGQSNLLWKADYAELYVKQFPDLTVTNKQDFKYVGSDQVDTMFLLTKTT